MFNESSDEIKDNNNNKYDTLSKILSVSHVPYSQRRLEISKSSEYFNCLLKRDLK